MLSVAFLCNAIEQNCEVETSFSLESSNFHYHNPAHPKILKILMLTIDRRTFRSRGYSGINNAQASIIAQDPSCVRMTKRLIYCHVVRSFFCVMKWNKNCEVEISLALESNNFHYHNPAHPKILKILIQTIDC